MPISLRVLKFFSNILLVMFLFRCNSSPAINFKKTPSQKNNFKVALLPYGNFDTALLSYVKNETEIFYNCEVVSLKLLPLPSFAFYPLRNRYRADSLLKYQKNILPQHVDAVAGLTNKSSQGAQQGIVKKMAGHIDSGAAAGMQNLKRTDAAAINRQWLLPSAFVVLARWDRLKSMTVCATYSSPSMRIGR